MERTVRIPAAMRAPVRRPKRRLALRPDDQLVALVRAGDAAAFEVLYERYAAPVLGFCRHMLGSQEEAEDAVQQAFVSAHGALLRGGSDVAFKPWLYTIARNRCVSMLRARREQPSELPELSTAGLSEEVERRSDLRELVHDVQRLPEQQRAALLLSELEDLSHAEVAEVIGVAPHKVKALVFRARSALGERQEARAADCGEIRVELAAAKGGGLRRGRLRYHLESCPACAAYLDEVRRQRRLLGVALPVIPALALKESVMREIGLGGAAAAGAIGGAGGGGAAAGAGGAASTGSAASTGGAASAGSAAAGGAAVGGAVAGAGAAGGGLLGGAAVKVVVGAALLVGGAGVATEVARDGGSEHPAGGTPPAAERRAPDDGSPGAADPSPAPGVPAARALERRGGARGAERRRLGQRRAAERSGGRSAGERGAKARGPFGERGKARGTGGQAGAVGRALGRDGARARPDGAGAAPAGGRAAPRTDAGAGGSRRGAGGSQGGAGGSQRGAGGGSPSGGSGGASTERGAASVPQARAPSRPPTERVPPSEVIPE